MSQRLLVSVMAALLCISAWASEPGQPLDCSDWVFLKPGLSCSSVRPPDCYSEPICNKGSTLQTDNEGELLFLRQVPVVDEGCSCLSWSDSKSRIELVAYNETSKSYAVLAYLPDRCNGCTVDRAFLQNGEILSFDDKTGVVMFPVATYCDNFGCSSCCSYTSDRWSPTTLVGIAGFATTFDVLQTYTLQSSAIGFRVPFMPEGMPAADYFDTYWGDLSTVGNWSQAHGLQCHYPAAAPARGDYLTVADPLPTPGPGHGYYYVTAATYQGQTRYGRKTSGGRLTGRNPGSLPVCSPVVQK